MHDANRSDGGLKRGGGAGPCAYQTERVERVALHAEAFGQVQRHEKLVKVAAGHRPPRLQQRRLEALDRI